MIEFLTSRLAGKEILTALFRQTKNNPRWEKRCRKE